MRTERPAVEHAVLRVPGTVPIMRLWSIHPRYLDPQGLTACWREALLAQAVLAGRTRGYRRHPQLERFRMQTDPVGAIGAYLTAVADDATARSYRFDRSRVERPGSAVPALTVTDGQLVYEWSWFTRKLAGRSPETLARWEFVQIPEPHPCFVVTPGPIEPWERLAP
ncbi:MAG: pyrimidine dimer DNA glycosylase/endonuclease V [Aeromicrobium sp.]